MTRPILYFSTNAAGRRSAMAQGLNARGSAIGGGLASGWPQAVTTVRQDPDRRRPAILTDAIRLTSTEVLSVVLDCENADGYLELELCTQNIEASFMRTLDKCIATNYKFTEPLDFFCSLIGVEAKTRFEKLPKMLEILLKNSRLQTLDMGSPDQSHHLSLQVSSSVASTRRSEWMGSSQSLCQHVGVPDALSLSLSRIWVT